LTITSPAGHFRHHPVCENTAGLSDLFAARAFPKQLKQLKQRRELIFAVEQDRQVTWY
jgi:hypothetical protein